MTRGSVIEPDAGRAATEAVRRRLDSALVGGGADHGLAAPAPRSAWADPWQSVRVTRVVAQFLGTGNFLARDRYWNSFVLDGHLLVEPAPTAGPHLRRVGISASDIDVVAISHFHADHTFGWPFLLLELVQAPRSGPLHVVGPPAVRSFLRSMLELGGVPNIADAAEQVLDMTFVEVDGRWQSVGPLRLRGVEVDHVPELDCYGYLFEISGQTVGYSGDTRPCNGLDEIAAAADVLILECNGPHDPALPVTHMDLTAVEQLHRRHPDLPLVLTHLGAEPDTSNLSNTVVPDDLEALELPTRPSRLTG